ncbi:thioesterase [Streptococcaceae bacterium ESL0687]|nr:thioesterase [Streptococcaceae bacterium ESL0687]
MGLKYSKDYQVSYFDTDVNGNMKLPHIMSVALEVSGEHGRMLGRSDSYMLEEYGCGWIVLEYRFEINRLPKHDEIVRIETEATKFNKFFTYRDFTYYDADGQELIKIYSTWSLMDLASRKIVNITDEIVEPYQTEKINTIIRGNKYKKLSEVSLEQEYNVRFYDLDINGHVNNTIYFDWMLDVLDRDFLTIFEPKTLHFKYLKEIHYGSKVTSKVLLEEDDLVSYHEICSSDEKNAQAEIIWRRRNNEV